MTITFALSTQFVLVYKLHLQSEPTKAEMSFFRKSMSLGNEIDNEMINEKTYFIDVQFSFIISSILFP